MEIELSDEILSRAEVNKADLRIALAVQLYVDNKIDHTDACRLAGVSSIELNRELLWRGITVQQYPAITAARKQAG